MRPFTRLIAPLTLCLGSTLVTLTGTIAPAHAAPSQAPVYFGWQTGSLIGGSQYGTLSSVSCVSSTACYALGASPTGENAMYATSDAGQDWARIPSPAAPGEFYTGLSCTDIRHCWITSAALTFNPADQTSSVFFFDPSTQARTKQTLPADAATGFLSGVTCVSNSACWAFGSTIIATTDGGTTWSDQPDPLTAATGIRAMSFSSPLDGVAVGADTVLRTTDAGASWHAATIPGALLTNVDCFSTTGCLAVGVLDSAAGTAWRTDDGGASWVEQSVPAGLFPSSIVCGSSSGGSTICRLAATSSAGAALASTADGGSTWSTESLPAEIVGPGASLTGISCSAFTLCVAVGVHPDHSGAIISAVNGAVQVGTQQCADVALLTIRGTGEQIDQAPQVDQAAANLGSALPLATTYRTVKVPYAAAPFQAFEDLPAIFESVNQGVIIGDTIVRNMALNCPHEEIVIIGFSQGAWVADLMLTNLQNEKVTGTHHVLGDWVTHVSLLGDPLRMAGRAIDVAAIPSGSWPAGEPQPTIDNVAQWQAQNGLVPYALGNNLGENIPRAFTKEEHGWTRTVSWCVPGDWICDTPGIGLSHVLSNDLAIHNLYTDSSIQTGIATAARGHVIDALARFSRSGP